MIEVIGNLWTFPADVRVITTNGTVKRNGECVMGRGCAAEAKKKYPELPKLLGNHLKAKGNIPFWLLCDRGVDPFAFDVLTFPVKHEWHQRADLDLIKASAEWIMNDFELDDFQIVMPRPGCGNGGLKWEDVKPVLEPILDDRFHVITWK